MVTCECTLAKLLPPQAQTVNRSLKFQNASSKRRIFVYKGRKKSLQNYKGAIMNNLLLKSNQAVGIVGYGAYIPRYRLTGKEIAHVWTNGLGASPVKEKAVAGLD